MSIPENLELKTIKSSAKIKYILNNGLKINTKVGIFF